MGNDWSERCADCGRRPVDGYGAYSVVYCCRAAYEDHKAAECSCTEAEPRTATRPRKRRTSRPAFGVDNHDR